ncbi:MAG: hypothetical protein IKF90_12325 [Parasporobacterium sp.]|nr:hypothetical protein [Parasporobacterium sp.]
MAQGRNFLKVCGILMIIGGAVTIIVSGIIGIVGYVAGSAVSGMGEYGAGAVLGVAALISAILYLIGGIVELIAGIIGVKNNNRPEKATTCIVFGFIVLVINLIGTILSISGSSSAGSIIVSIICSVALPVLYLIGAFLNKKSA